MNTTAATARYIGTTDDTTACEHCGRVDLKMTVVLELLDAEGNGAGEVVYYGSTCAARALAPRGIRTTAARVRFDAEVANRQTIERAEYAANRLARYSGPDAVEMFRDSNRQWGTELRSVEWATKALAEMVEMWTAHLADARLIGWAA